MEKAGSCVDGYCRYFLNARAGVTGLGALTNAHSYVVPAQAGIESSIYISIRKSICPQLLTLS
jgi:hypothetical protein